MIELVSKILSIMTVAAQIFLVGGLIYFLAVRRDRGNRFRGFLWRRGPFLAFLVALAATLGSLFYSQVAGYPPCDLCWYQRIAMYPLVVLLAMSLMKKDRSVLDYGLALLIIGALLSLYHNYLYYGRSALAACTISGSGVSCLAQYVTEFNYVTIPIMALSAFLLMIFLLSVARRPSI